MSYLLDTNVISELRKGERANPGVTSWFAGVPSDALYLSVLVIGELGKGIARLRRRDPVSAAHLERWQERLVASFTHRILPVSLDVAELWGGLQAGGPLPVIDSLLAATAEHHGLTLVTRNVGDMASTGVALLNPFDAS